MNVRKKEEEASMSRKDKRKIGIEKGEERGNQEEGEEKRREVVHCIKQGREIGG